VDQADLEVAEAAVLVPAPVPVRVVPVPVLAVDGKQTKSILPGEKKHQARCQLLGTL